MTAHWLKKAFSVRKRPSGAELDRRLQASRDLAEQAQQHIEVAQELRENNHLGAMVLAALGITNGERKR